MKLLAISLSLVTIFITMPVRADHLPSSQLALGRPENRLGPVVLDRTQSSELTQLYGEPNKSQLISDDDKGKRGERIYSWNVGPDKLEVRTWFQPKGESAIDSVEVWGTSTGSFVTGRGLHLGSTLADVKRLYGNRFQSGKKQQTGFLFAFLQWHIGTELHVDFDKKGRANHILLLAPQE